MLKTEKFNRSVTFPGAKPVADGRPSSKQFFQLHDPANHPLDRGRDLIDAFHDVGHKELSGKDL